MAKFGMEELVVPSRILKVCVHTHSEVLLGSSLRRQEPHTSPLSLCSLRWNLTLHRTVYILCLDTSSDFLMFPNLLQASPCSFSSCASSSFPSFPSCESDSGRAAVQSCILVGGFPYAAFKGMDMRSSHGVKNILLLTHFSSVLTFVNQKR